MIEEATYHVRLMFSFEAAPSLDRERLSLLGSLPLTYYNNQGQPRDFSLFTGAHSLEPGPLTEAAITVLNL